MRPSSGDVSVQTYVSLGSSRTEMKNQLHNALVKNTIVWSKTSTGGHSHSHDHNLTIDVALTGVDLETGSEEELSGNFDAVRRTESRLVVEQLVRVTCRHRT